MFTEFRTCMKWLILILSISIGALAAYAQTDESSLESPDRVLTRYLKMINDGDLLTKEGWQKACPSFVELSPYSSQSTISVTTRFPSAMGTISVKGDHAEADVKWVDPIGEIDESLKYHPPPKTEAEGTIFVFNLALSERHCEVLQDGTLIHNVVGTRQWRIDGPLTTRAASREATIRFLNEQHDLSADPVIKKNAEESIAILKRLPARRKHI
jgi:hypothetical protein